MSKNEIKREYSKVSILINNAEKEGDYKRRQSLEKLQTKIADAYFFNFIMPQIKTVKA